MSWWDTEPYSGEYGGRTVVPPAWPQVDEYVLSQAAQKFETLATVGPLQFAAEIGRRGERLGQDFLPGAGEAAR